MISSFDDHLAERRNGRMARDDYILGLVAYDSRTTPQTCRINTDTVCVIRDLTTNSFASNMPIVGRRACNDGAAYFELCVY